MFNIKGDSHINGETFPLTNIETFKPNLLTYRFPGQSRHHAWSSWRSGDQVSTISWVRTWNFWKAQATKIHKCHNQPIGAQIGYPSDIFWLPVPLWYHFLSTMWNFGGVYYSQIGSFDHWTKSYKKHDCWLFPELIEQFHFGIFNQIISNPTMAMRNWKLEKGALAKHSVTVSSKSARLLRSTTDPWEWYI